MKKSICSLCLSVLLTLGYSSHAQQNKPVSDTLGFRNEYSVLHNDITGLNRQLIVAKSNLSAYLSNAVSTKAVNKSGAAKQPSKMVAGKSSQLVAETKKDYEMHSQAENKRLNRLHDNIFILASEISKKQQRLQELSAAEIL